MSRQWRTARQALAALRQTLRRGGVVKVWDEAAQRFRMYVIRPR